MVRSVADYRGQFGCAFGTISATRSDSAFLFLTVYAVRMSPLAIGELVRQQCEGLGGMVECGELGVREESGRLALPTAIFARWSR